ncbi:hypothetical protein DRQ53_01335 [bacterium]|nr:MAG: hypothetical protein DRQ32_00460 [bacterium]RKZ18209.1 MAG: hypothetical protein DRQ53_01335 [bacterium]
MSRMSRMSSGVVAIEPGDAAGVARRWQELHASGADFGTAAPRMQQLASASLRSGPIFSQPDYIARLQETHQRLGADAASLSSIDALAQGAACVVTGQQPHLLSGPFYTAYKILGAIALADRLQQLHGSPVVPVFWCGTDDSDFAEVASAWLFDPERGPWRLRIPASAWQPGSRVGDIDGDLVATLENSALAGLQGDGLEWMRAAATRIGGVDFGERSASWLLQLFAGNGLVVVDARDDLLLAAQRPLLESYAARRGEVEAAVDARARERLAAGWPMALDEAARASGVFALQDGRRVKVSPQDLESGAAMGSTWSPSVLMRPVVQDALLAPVSAVLGPGEMAYHAEIAPVYELLEVEAARPVARPQLTLVGEDWHWPHDPAAVRRLLGGGHEALDELTRSQLGVQSRAAFDDFGRDLESALQALESKIGHGLTGRARARIMREMQRLARGEAEASGAPVQRRAEWLARGGVSQERLYSSWLLWAWSEDPAHQIFDPLGRAWIDAVDRGLGVQWTLAVEHPG